MSSKNTIKNTIRKEARARRAALSASGPDFAARIANLAAQLLLETGVAVASYCPFRDEADPGSLARVLAERGHPLLLPRIEGPDRPLVFRRWQAGDATERNSWGIVEPLRTAEAVEPKALLVPLLAFDDRGHRLGYGGGYYDRSLASLRAKGDVIAICIAYAGQEMNPLPHDRHDEPLDMVLTEEGLRRFGRRRDHQSPGMSR